MKNTYNKIENRNLFGSNIKFKFVPKRLILNLKDIYNNENELKKYLSIFLSYLLNKLEIFY